MCKGDWREPRPKTCIPLKNLAQGPRIAGEVSHRTAVGSTAAFLGPSRVQLRTHSLPKNPVLNGRDVTVPIRLARSTWESEHLGGYT